MIYKSFAVTVFAVVIAFAGCADETIAGPAQTSDITALGTTITTKLTTVDKDITTTLNTLDTQNKAQGAPGELLPLGPLWSNIPVAETLTRTVLQNQLLDESLFQLYNINALTPITLIGLPSQTVYYSKHFAVYCSGKATPETANFSTCTSDNNNIEIEYAQLKPSTLLNTPRYDTNTSTAALEFIRSVTDPFATSNILSLFSDASKLDDEKTKSKIVAALTRQAKLNIPIYSMLEAYAKRLPSPENPLQPTFMEILETEASKRYTNPAWHASISAHTMSQEGLLKDIAVMLASQLWIQKEQYKQAERLELLLSLSGLMGIASQDQIAASNEKGEQATQAASTKAKE